MSCLSGARTEKRETGDEGEECEEFFHRGGVVGGWVLTALYAAITSDWPPAGFIHGCDGLGTTLRFGIGKSHAQ